MIINLRRVNISGSDGLEKIISANKKRGGTMGRKIEDKEVIKALYYATLNAKTEDCVKRGPILMTKKQFSDILIQEKVCRHHNTISAIFMELKHEGIITEINIGDGVKRDALDVLKVRAKYGMSQSRRAHTILTHHSAAHHFDAHDNGTPSEPSESTSEVPK